MFNIDGVKKSRWLSAISYRNGSARVFLTLKGRGGDRKSTIPQDRSQSRVSIIIVAVTDDGLVDKSTDCG